MPPVRKAGGQQFRKDVEFVTKDDDEQIAAGIVMVPDKVDLQNDFVREETIRSFADQFETFVEAGQAGGGIMHAVFPDGWMDLERNEVLDEAEEIGGEEAPAGAWIQEWAINHGDLWELILEGVIAGYSIGAINVDWNGPYEQDDLEDVDVPEELGENPLVWELIDGIIREVSAVDIPAVPDAQILETKADAEKRLGDYLGDPNGFVEEALERGHTESEAELLWSVLNDAAEVEGSSEPGKMSFFERIGKAAVSAFRGEDTQTGDSPDRQATQKEGRTLSRANERRQMAVIDAALDTLQDAGFDHGMTRFTDREDVEFDLTEHSAREWPAPDEEEEEGEDEESDAPPINNAAGGDTPDDGGTNAADDTTDMTDDDPMEDAPEWAQTLHDDIQENSKRLDEQGDQIEAALEATEEEKTAQIEIDGEIYEVTESEAKAWFEDGEEPSDDPMDDAPGYARALADKVENVNNRIDTISEQSGIGGQSQQLERADEDNDGSGLDELGEALS